MNDSEVVPPRKRGKRKSISTRRRFEIFKRDGFTCQYCGATPPAVVLHVEHVLAVANGGDNDEGNLITSCAVCNLGKGAIPLDCVPKSLAGKAEEVAEREAQIRGYAKIMEARRRRIQRDIWSIAKALCPAVMDITAIPVADIRSLKMFASKLPTTTLVEAAELARAKIPNRDPWPYFCGICWKLIKEDRDAV